jgi:hypothetical protein
MDALADGERRRRPLADKCHHALATGQLDRHLHLCAQVAETSIVRLLR